MADTDFEQEEEWMDFEEEVNIMHYVSLQNGLFIILTDMSSPSFSP